MIHDVTIPFSFDTSPIEAQVAQFGENEAKKVIREVTMRGICSVMPSKNKSYWNDGKAKDENDINWKSYVDERVGEWLERHKEEVIDEASLLLAMRGSRKKVWREVLEEYKAERDA